MRQVIKCSELKSKLLRFLAFTSREAEYQVRGVIGAGWEAVCIQRVADQAIILSDVHGKVCMFIKSCGRVDWESILRGAVSKGLDISLQEEEA